MQLIIPYCLTTSLIFRANLTALNKIIFQPSANKKIAYTHRCVLRAYGDEVNVFYFNRISNSKAQGYIIQSVHG